MDLENLNKDRKIRRKSGSLDVSTMMYGKVPPQAKDLEDAVLGSIMNEKGVFDIVAEILQPECFYVESHQRIFRSMMGLAQKNLPIDLLTVVEELKFREELDVVGGAYYVSKLTNAVVSSANVQTHARIVLQKFIQREAIRISGEIIGDAYEDSTDIFELLSEMEEKVFGLTLNYIKKDYNTIDRGLVKVMERIEHLRKIDESVTGVPTGYSELDKVTHGWQAGDLIILAARPSVGKTAFALNLARKAALHPTKPTAIGFFSLEMSEGQLINRILSAESQIWLTRLKNGRLDDDQMKTLYKKGVERLASAPICIDDTAGLNMFELKAKVRRMKNKHNVGLIIIDYLQLMSANRQREKNREQEISFISRELKKLAKDVGLPILALSQLSREVEKRGKGQKIPQLSDLRESGAIEQDADIVMFLYRPPEEDVKEDAELRDKGLLRIAKHRDGELSDIPFNVNNNVQQWEEKTSVPSNLKSVAQANAEQLRFYNEPKDPQDDLPF